MDQILADLELPLYRFLLRLSRNRESAADLTQETLLRAWKCRKQLRDERAARVWVFRVAVNLWKDHCRAAGSRRNSQHQTDPPSRLADPSEMAEANELGEAVWRAIDGLPERQKQVMHLRVLDQMEPKEIAETLQLSPQLVRSNLAAARKNLRHLLAPRVAVPPVEKST